MDPYRNVLLRIPYLPIDDFYSNWVKQLFLLPINEEVYVKHTVGTVPFSRRLRVASSGCGAVGVVCSLACRFLPKPCGR